MPKVKGKVQLCSCIKKYFKSVQGLGEHSLFDRYRDIENVVKKRINEKFTHFLAQPENEDDTIIWFSKPYIETPKRFSELRDEERSQYELIKNETIEHYQDAIQLLRNEGNISEAKSLESAIKFINDDFLYCFDGKVVLGIWGMQLKDNVREPFGIAMNNLFQKIKKPTTEQSLPDNSQQPELEQSKLPPEKPFIIRFNPGDSGSLNGNSELLKHSGEIVTINEVPKIESEAGYEFTGWDINPNNFNVNGDTEFTAQYKTTTPPIPWYKRFWNYLRGLFFGRGWLKWILWLLLLLLLLLLLSWLFRSCSGGDVAPIPDPINGKPWVHDDPRVGDDGGIYDPGNPYETIPTPPEYIDILPPNQGVLPPIDTTEIIRKPGDPVIIGNRLNILMENEDKSILDLAKEFKLQYPDDKYKVVYYDDVVKRMQIEVPPVERIKLKSDIPKKFAPTYELFVFDESLFEIGYIPNDPHFQTQTNHGTLIL